MSKNTEQSGSRIIVEPQLLIAPNGAERMRRIGGREYVSSEDVIRGLGRSIRVFRDGVVLEEASVEPKFDRLFGQDTHASLANKAAKKIAQLAGRHAVAAEDIASVFATKQEILAKYDVISGGGLYAPGKAVLLTSAAVLLQAKGQDCAAFIRTDVNPGHGLNNITIETAGSASGRVWKLFYDAVETGESVANIQHYESGSLPSAYQAADRAMRQVIDTAFTAVA